MDFVCATLEGEPSLFRKRYFFYPVLVMLGELCKDTVVLLMVYVLVAGDRRSV